MPLLTYTFVASATGAPHGKPRCESYRWEDGPRWERAILGASGRGAPMGERLVQGKGDGTPMGELPSHALARSCSAMFCMLRIEPGAYAETCALIISH